MPVYTLTSVAGSGAYTGTFSGGASNAYAGLVFTVTGFTINANNGTWVATGSSATTLTLANSASVSETHAATATDITKCTVLDPGGLAEPVVTTATTTGTAFSKEFCVLDRPGGGTRNLWLQLASVSGTFTVIKADVQSSMDGGQTWTVLEGGVDLFNSPSQQVSPPPSPGMTLRLNVGTFTGGTSFSILASSN